MQIITHIMSMHVFVWIWFPSLELSWVQICLYHLGSPELLWQHCVCCLWSSPCLQPPAGLIEVVSTCHSTGCDYTKFLITAGILFPSLANLQILRFFSLLCKGGVPNISKIHGHSPGTVTGIPLGLSHAKQNLRQPCYSELIMCTEKIFHTTKPWSEVQERNPFES